MSSIYYRKDWKKESSINIERENLKVKKIIPHPLFTKVDGLPEYWEKAYWRNKI